MSEKKTKVNFNFYVVIGSILLFTVLYIAFMSLSFVNLGSSLTNFTGFMLLEFDVEGVNALSIINLVLASIIIVLAIVNIVFSRINVKTFVVRLIMLIQVIFGLALAIITIILFVKIGNLFNILNYRPTVIGGSTISPQRRSYAAGAILHLIMGILTALSSALIFFVQKSEN
ncbi:MAG: hypothetical protein LBL66_07480 [Clostridiales bacterium]|jgi:hypothetical protein|nr:hypothetical protein [Clostridiales bacterium]